MKLQAESWPPTQSVFECAKFVRLTAESENEAKALAQILTAIHEHGCEAVAQRLSNDADADDDE